MASTYSNAGIELIADGEQSGTWGQTTNTNWSLMEELATGVVELTLSSSSYTLTTSDGASSDGRHMVLKLSGTPGATCTITVAPNTLEKLYFVDNTTSNDVIFTQGSGGNTTVSANNVRIIYCDGAGPVAEVRPLMENLATTYVDAAGDTMTGALNFGDSIKAQFGDSQDLQIYHDASHSYITDAGTGNLKIAASQVDLLGGSDGAETMATFVDDGAVTLYYDDASKLATTATGIDVTGTAEIDTLSIGGTAVTATPDELNQLDGVTLSNYADRTADQSWTGSHRATVVEDNDGSFDMDGGMNFKCTPTGDFTLTFTNIADGQSGFVLLINTGGHSVSLHTNSKGSSELATTITTAGTYLLSYFSDGTNVYLTNSKAYA